MQPTLINSPHVAYDFDRANYSAIGDILKNTDWDNFFRATWDANMCWDAFHNLLKTCISQHVPTRYAHLPSQVRFPKDTIALIKAKANAWNYHSKHPSPESKTTFKNLTRLVRVSIRAHYKAIENKILTAKSTHSLFAFIRSKLNPTLRNIMLIDSAKRCISNAADIAHLFCIYFTSVFSIDKTDCLPFP